MHKLMSLDQYYLQAREYCTVDSATTDALDILKRNTVKPRIYNFRQEVNTRWTRSELKSNKSKAFVMAMRAKLIYLAITNR